MGHINKVCSRCKESKPLTLFCNNKNGKQGKHHYCKKCLSVQRSNKYKSDSVYREKLKWNQRLRKYHITKDDYNTILLSQSNSCSICSKPFKKDRNIFIDHDHGTIIRFEECLLPQRRVPRSADADLLATVQQAEASNRRIILEIGGHW